MKKILVTGASGQLGQSFVSLFSQKYDLLFLKREELDITKLNQLKKHINQFKPEIILNCAALTNVDLAEEDHHLANEINIFSIKKILSVFKGLFIHISSDYIFDGKNGPYKESDKPNPINYYGKSKLEGEKIIKDNSDNWMIIRTNILFDLGSKASFLDWVINALENNRRIDIVNDQINNPVWTNDLSKMINFLIEKNKNGIFHIGSNLLLSRYDFAIMIAKIWGFKPNNIYPISTEELRKNVKSYIASRPKKSGLISEFDLPIIDLERSLTKLKNI